jgi:hypothetical protein
MTKKRQPYYTPAAFSATRKDAVARGQKFYFTGKQCPKGHVSPRYVVGGACAACTHERRVKAGKKWREANGYTMEEVSKNGVFVELLKNRASR